MQFLQPQYKLSYLIGTSLRSAVPAILMLLLMNGSLTAVEGFKPIVCSLVALFDLALGKCEDLAGLFKLYTDLQL